MARYTDGDGLDLTTIERNAWQAGEILLAQLAARAQDAEELAEGEEDRIAAAHEEGKAEGIESVREPLRHILDELKATAAELRKAARRCKGAQDWLDELDAALVELDRTTYG